jgi:tetratricopeptide (TPR) repeat protein
MALGVDAGQFVQMAQPLLQRQDLPALIAAFRGRFTAAQIQSFLNLPHPEVRKLAAFSLGLVGERDCVPALAAALHDEAPIRDVAEHALWSVWFRLGSPCANRCVARATQSMDRCEFQAARDLIAEALERSPNFPEAYNQRAILHYLNERYDQSLADCRRTVALMPLHFGAWAGMGHCYAHLSQPACVLRSYQRALSINPNLEGMRQAVGQLRGCCLRIHSIIDEI